jgi:hypothetical protein
MSKRRSVKPYLSAVVVGMAAATALAGGLYLSSPTVHAAHNAREINRYAAPGLTVWWLGASYGGHSAVARITVGAGGRSSQPLLVSYGDPRRDGVSIETRPRGSRGPLGLATGETLLGPSYYQALTARGGQVEPAHLSVILADGEILTLTAGLEAPHRDFIPLIRGLLPTR